MFRAILHRQRIVSCPKWCSTPVFRRTIGNVTTYSAPNDGTNRDEKLRAAELAPSTSISSEIARLKEDLSKQQAQIEALKRAHEESTSDKPANGWDTLDLIIVCGGFAGVGLYLGSHTDTLPDWWKSGWGGMRQMWLQEIEFELGGVSRDAMKLIEESKLMEEVGEDKIKHVVERHGKSTDGTVEFYCKAFTTDKEDQVYCVVGISSTARDNGIGELKNDVLMNAEQVLCQAAVYAWYPAPPTMSVNWEKATTSTIPMNSSSSVWMVSLVPARKVPMYLRKELDNAYIEYQTKVQNKLTFEQTMNSCLARYRRWSEHEQRLIDVGCYWVVPTPRIIGWHYPEDTKGISATDLFDSFS